MTLPLTQFISNCVKLTILSTPVRFSQCLMCEGAVKLEWGAVEGQCRCSEGAVRGDNMVTTCVHSCVKLTHFVCIPFVQTIVT